jgi:N-acyl-D-amino-acid deacylase
MFDLLIKGGFVIDGTGSPMLIEDVAIKNDEIAETGRLDNVTASETIDASGLYVCPGFIDIHSHSDFNILVTPPGQSKIQQGITTEVCGNCGLSAAPLFGMVRSQHEKSLKALGVDIKWSSLKEFIRFLEGIKLLTNFVPLVGHGNIRGAVIGYDNRTATSAEIKKMADMLSEAMGSGAWGLSSGLIYPPGVYANTDELVSLAGVINKFKGIYTSHIRNEGDFVLEAIEEAIRIGKESGVPVQISHLKTMWGKNWVKLESVMEMIEKAIDDGVNVTADRYPYCAACTGLDAVLPSWACQGGRKTEIDLLRSESRREEIYQSVLKSISEKELADDITVSRISSRSNKALEGKTLGEVSELRKQQIKNALFDLLIEEELEVDAIFFCMSKDNLKTILGKNFVMIGSDSSVWDIHGPLSMGVPHPRSFGAFPRVLSEFVFNENILSIESAIRKMTGQPAEKIGITDRGLIKNGYKADIVIFSKDDLKDNSTYKSPHKYPSGINRIMVNGKWVLEKGSVTGEFPGRILLKK